MINLASVLRGPMAGDLIIVKNISNHYVAAVKTYSKLVPRIAGMALLTLVLTGCGGVQASRSVSPASILLPGLLQVDPPKSAPAHTPPALVNSPEFSLR